MGMKDGRKRNKKRKKGIWEGKNKEKKRRIRNRRKEYGFKGRKEGRKQ